MIQKKIVILVGRVRAVLCSGYSRVRHFFNNENLHHKLHHRSFNIICNILGTYNVSQLLLVWEEEPVKVAQQLHLTEYKLSSYETLTTEMATSLSNSAFRKFHFAMINSNNRFILLISGS